MSLAFIPKSLSGGACTDGVAGGGGAGGQPEKLKVNDNSFKQKKTMENSYFVKVTMKIINLSYDIQILYSHVNPSFFVFVDILNKFQLL